MDGRYQIKFIDGKISVERPVLYPTENRKLQGSIQRTGTRIKFVPENVDEIFNDFFSDFAQNIMCMQLPKKDKTKIFVLCGKLIAENKNFIERFLEKSETKSDEVVNILTETQHYVIDLIDSFKTDYHRNIQSKKNPYYVAPVEKGMGLNWKTKTTPELDFPDHKMVQTTFQIVPISSKIKALFSNPIFKSTFLEYNSSRHECINGVYKDYCCGSVSQDDAFFRCRDTVVIQFGVDEFDVCCGLKTKATIHKIFAVYFRI